MYELKPVPFKLNRYPSSRLILNPLVASRRTGMRRLIPRTKNPAASHRREFLSVDFGRAIRHGFYASMDTIRSTYMSLACRFSSPVTAT
jgi:hypothetical protein